MAIDEDMYRDAWADSLGIKLRKTNFRKPISVPGGQRNKKLGTGKVYLVVLRVMLQNPDAHCSAKTITNRVGASTGTIADQNKVRGYLMTMVAKGLAVRTGERRHYRFKLTQEGKHYEF